MIRCLLAATFALFALPVAMAAEFSGYAAVTSDYVKRGVSQSDADAAIQLGGDVFFDSGLFLGAWGSTVDINNGPTRQRDLELNLYAGFSYDVSKLWRVSARVVSYLYPGQTGEFDYDYVEYSLAVNYDDRYWLEYSYSPDLYNTSRVSHNIEAYTERQQFPSLSQRCSLKEGNQFDQKGCHIGKMCFKACRIVVFINRRI